MCYRASATAVAAPKNKKKPPSELAHITWQHISLKSLFSNSSKMLLPLLLNPDFSYTKRSRSEVSIAVYSMSKFHLVQKLWTCHFGQIEPKNSSSFFQRFGWERFWLTSNHRRTFKLGMHLLWTIPQGCFSENWTPLPSELSFSLFYPLFPPFSWSWF